MAGQRPWARETVIGVTERGATQLYGWEGAEYTAKIGREDPNPVPAAEGRRSLQGGQSARAPRAQTQEKRAGAASRVKGSQPTPERARPCAPGLRSPSAN